MAAQRHAVTDDPALGGSIFTSWFQRRLGLNVEPLGGRIVKKLCALILAFTAFAQRAQGPPIGVLLLRIDTPWVYPPPEVENRTRTAPATVLLFRSNGEYVEHHFWIIEQADKTLRMSLGDGHVVVIGSWRRGGKGAIATRRIFNRTVPVIGRDPVCDRSNLDFVVQSETVTGATGPSTMREYRPNVALKLPEFETYTSQARRAGTRCDAENSVTNGK